MCTIMKGRHLAKTESEMRKQVKMDLGGGGAVCQADLAGRGLRAVLGC
jgi:hypothetical protein